MSAAAPAAADTAALEAFLREKIPLARAMDLRITARAPRRLRLHAPLAANVNDKGCAFGGSLASLLTLAPWALLELTLRAAGIEADIFVADAQIRYLAPVWTDIEADAGPAPDAELDAFVATLRARGKARITMQAEVGAAERPACVQTARFVARLRGT